MLIPQQHRRKKKKMKKGIQLRHIQIPPLEKDLLLSPTETNIAISIDSKRGGIKLDYV